jgi:nitrite reductase/ring-hydroxylating ferredoxin subunit
MFSRSSSGLGCFGSQPSACLADLEVVICPLHQHVFELATGCSRTGQPPLRVYPVRVENEQIIVERAAG